MTCMCVSFSLSYLHLRNKKVWSFVSNVILFHKMSWRHDLSNGHRLPHVDLFLLTVLSIFPNNTRFDEIVGELYMWALCGTAFSILLLLDFCTLPPTPARYWKQLCCIFVPSCFSVYKAQTQHWGSKWLPQFSTFRGNDKGGMGSEQCLCVRGCMARRGRDIVLHETSHCRGFKPVRKR